MSLRMLGKLLFSKKSAKPQIKQPSEHMRSLASIEFGLIATIFSALIHSEVNRRIEAEDSTRHDLILEIEELATSWKTKLKTTVERDRIEAITELLGKLDILKKRISIA